MKKLLVLALIVIMTGLLASPALARRVRWIQLDEDVQCRVSGDERGTTVIYTSNDGEYLGQEMWTKYRGIIVDTYEPWTFPFPS